MNDHNHTSQDCQPPRSAVALLRWFCAPHWLSEIEGDLQEQFGKRLRTVGCYRARLLYWKDMALFFRPYVLRRDLFKPSQPIGPLMWTNYFKTAIRHLSRHKGYAGLNITGLAIGMACCLLALLFARDELRYDQFHEKKDRIYRVVTEMVMPNGAEGTFSSTDWPIGRKIREGYPEAEKVVYMRSHPDKVTHEGAYHYQSVRYAENEFFDLFTFPFAEGDPQTALTDPYTAVITREMADKFFLGQQAVGQTLTMRDTVQYTVTGILEDIPQHSHLQFDILASFETFRAETPSVDNDDHWLDINMFNYVLLAKGVAPQTLESKIANMYDVHIGDYMEEVGYKARLRLEPMTDIYLHSGIGNRFGPASDITYVYLLGGIGLFVLLIAGVNFVNLSTARSVERAREVGVRKVVGSTRGLLVQQFLGEALLTSTLALMLALLITSLALPYFNSMAEKQLVLTDLLQWEFFLGVLAVGGGIGIFAGLYPAFVLSGFKPIAVLKGSFSKSRSGIVLRRGLVVFQFTISCMLIVATLVVYQQLQHMQNADIGFDREQVVVVDARRAPDIASQVDLIKEQMAAQTGIVSVSATNAVPGRNGWRSIMVNPEGRSKDEGLITEFIAVDHDYVQTMGLQLIAGRDFDIEKASDKEDAVIINKAAIGEMGFGTPEDAIGKLIDAPNRNARGYVVGVVEDYNHHGLQEDIRSIVFGVKPYYSYFALRLNTSDASAVIAHLDDTWANLFPGYPFEYFFLDEDYDRQYRTEQRLTRIFTTFAILAILISCLGLFGLASFTTIQRTKEIGVRKVLGASVPGIVGLLSKEFVALIGIAFLIAAPASYYFLGQWLDGFAYRIDLGVGVFLLAAALSLLIAFATVSYQSLKAALANPSEALRFE